MRRACDECEGNRQAEKDIGQPVNKGCLVAVSKGNEMRRKASSCRGRAVRIAPLPTTETKEEEEEEENTLMVGMRGGYEVFILRGGRGETRRPQY